MRCEGCRGLIGRLNLGLGGYVSKEISVSCDVRDFADLNSLVPFQKELKSLSKEDYDRFRIELIETGIAFPIKVWEDEGRLNIVGGHQTHRMLTNLRDAEGFVIPPVPIVRVLAKDIKEAKRRVLQDISQYGRVERQGLYEFTLDAGMGPEDLAKFRIPEIDLASFNAEFFFDEIGTQEDKDRVGATEYSADEFVNFKHKCPRCGFAFDDGEARETS